MKCLNCESETDKAFCSFGCYKEYHEIGHPTNYEKAMEAKDNEIRDLIEKLKGHRSMVEQMRQELHDKDILFNSMLDAKNEKVEP